MQNERCIEPREVVFPHGLQFKSCYSMLHLLASKRLLHFQRVVANQVISLSIQLHGRMATGSKWDRDELREV